MLKTTEFLIATALAMLIAAPALAQSLTYVGNSDEKFNWAGGVLDFHAACDETFPGSQFCSSEDIIRGGAFPVVASTEAWVHPKIVAVDDDSSHVFLYSGNNMNTSNLSAACNGWASNAGSPYFGLVLNTPTGRFNLTNCNNTLAVTCCSKKEAKKGK